MNSHSKKQWGGYKKVDLTGKTIKDRYFIVEKAASGGSGALYLARDMELGCTWAVKEIPLSRRHEARLLRQMQHPGLPRMVDYAELQDTCCLVMEYVQGQSLAGILKERKSISYAKVLDLAEDTAVILTYLHTRTPPVCHADVKPENLIYTPEGKVKLVDFGSAAFSSEMPRSRTEGTPGYAPPEQAQGYLTCQGDIYSLGKTLEAALGRFGMLLHPDFAWFVRCCTRSAREDRFSDISRVSSALHRIRMHQKFGPLVFSGAAGALSILAALIFFNSSNHDAGDFCKELAQVTGQYYTLAAFCEGKENECGEKPPELKEVCEETEDRLQSLLAKYTGDREQTRILLLLAANAELAEDPKRSALYYEQVLLYHSEQEAAYPSYGLFLLRQGQVSQSLELWEDYQAYIVKREAEIQESGENSSLFGSGADVLKSHEGRLWKKRLNMLQQKAAQKTDLALGIEGAEITKSSSGAQ